MSSKCTRHRLGRSVLSLLLGGILGGTLIGWVLDNAFGTAPIATSGGDGGFFPGGTDAHRSAAWMSAVVEAVALGGDRHLGDEGREVAGVRGDDPAGPLLGLDAVGVREAARRESGPRSASGR